MTNPTDPYRAAAEPPAETQDRARRMNRRKASYLLTEADEFLLGQLPEPYVEILRQEGSMEDIARRLNIAPGTVKSRTHRARAALDALRARDKSAPPQ